MGSPAPRWPTIGAYALASGTSHTWVTAAISVLGALGLRSAGLYAKAKTQITSLFSTLTQKVKQERVRQAANLCLVKIDKPVRRLAGGTVRIRSSRRPVACRDRSAKQTKSAPSRSSLTQCAQRLRRRAQRDGPLRTSFVPANTSAIVLRSARKGIGARLAATTTTPRTRAGQAHARRCYTPLSIDTYDRLM